MHCCNIHDGQYGFSEGKNWAISVRFCKTSIVCLRKFWLMGTWRTDPDEGACVPFFLYMVRVLLISISYCSMT